MYLILSKSLTKINYDSFHKVYKTLSLEGFYKCKKSLFYPLKRENIKYGFIFYLTFDK